MVTLTNKDFQKLLSQAVIERHSSNEVQIFNETEDEFYFTCDLQLKKITAQGDIKLSEGQETQIFDKAYNFHLEHPIEDLNAFNSITEYDMYSETGTNPEMFI